jgi:hypothetical protein
MREMVRVIGIVVLLLPAACDRERQVGESQARNTIVEEIGPPQPIETSETLEFSPLEQPSPLGEATLHADGGEEGEEVSQFRPGDTVVVSLRMREVPPMLAAWVHWLNQEGETLHEEQKSVPEDGRLEFRADTSDWPEGVYTAEIYVGGALGDLKEFEITSGHQ